LQHLRHQQDRLVLYIFRCGLGDMSAVRQDVISNGFRANTRHHCAREPAKLIRKTRTESYKQPKGISAQKCLGGQATGLYRPSTFSLTLSSKSVQPSLPNAFNSAPLELSTSLRSLSLLGKSFGNLFSGLIFLRQARTPFQLNG